MIVLSSVIGSSASESTASTGPCKKKKKYHNFNKSWEKEMEWLSSSPKGIWYGYCKICDKHLLCGEGGIRDLKRHGETAGHKKMKKAYEGQRLLLSTWATSENAATKAARAEAILANMLVEHNLPFLLMDHLPGVLRHPFPDSAIAKEMKCARTKSTVTSL